mmetsp:Transcript_110867/g.254055  ORF Transcript_110867/g.254055 Transcript_110867/m.254055 type:complete len:608 (-) Transcript_110867:158-1981(-)
MPKLPSRSRATQRMLEQEPAVAGRVGARTGHRDRPAVVPTVVPAQGWSRVAGPAVPSSTSPRVLTSARAHPSERWVAHHSIRLFDKPDAHVQPWDWHGARMAPPPRRVVRGSACPRGARSEGLGSACSRSPSTGSQARSLSNVSDRRAWAAPGSISPRLAARAGSGTGSVKREAVAPVRQGCVALSPGSPDRTMSPSRSSPPPQRTGPVAVVYSPRPPHFGESPVFLPRASRVLGTPWTPRWSRRPERSPSPRYGVLSPQQQRPDLPAFPRPKRPAPIQITLVGSSTSRGGSSCLSLLPATAVEPAGTSSTCSDSGDRSHLFAEVDKDCCLNHDDDQQECRIQDACVAGMGGCPAPGQQQNATVRHEDQQPTPTVSAPGQEPTATAPAPRQEPTATAPAPRQEPTATAPAPRQEPTATAPAPGQEPTATTPAPDQEPTLPAPAPGLQPEPLACDAHRKVPSEPVAPVTSAPDRRCPARPAGKVICTPQKRLRRGRLVDGFPLVPVSETPEVLAAEDKQGAAICKYLRGVLAAFKRLADFRIVAKSTEEGYAITLTVAPLKECLGLLPRVLFLLSTEVGGKLAQDGSVSFVSAGDEPVPVVVRFIVET